MWVNIFELGTHYAAWGQRSSDGWFWAGGTSTTIDSAVDGILVDDCEPVFEYRASDHAVIRTPFDSTAGVNVLYLQVPGWNDPVNTFRVRYETTATDEQPVELYQMLLTDGDPFNEPSRGAQFYSFTTAAQSGQVEVPGVADRYGLAIMLPGAQANQPVNFFIEQWVEPGPEPVSYNCECDDDYPSTTLGEMRKRLLRRLGFAAQANNPPPGMADLLDDFIRQAQEILFRRYAVFRRERWFTWDLVPGVRFYDLDANADVCTKRLDPRMITWAGISQGDDSWRPLVCGIRPVMYSSRGPGIPSHYEIRQCIELWPAPSDATWLLRIKGQFGLLPLDADTDKTSLDPEAIFLLALANAKAHYGQPDADNYASQLAAYVRDLTRGSHMTRRYFPGGADPRNAVRPIPVGGWPEDQA